MPLDDAAGNAIGDPDGDAGAEALGIAADFGGGGGDVGIFGAGVGFVADFEFFGAGGFGGGWVGGGESGGDGEGVGGAGLDRRVIGGEIGQRESDGAGEGRTNLAGRGGGAAGDDFLAVEGDELALLALPGGIERIARRGGGRCRGGGGRWRAGGGGGRGGLGAGHGKCDTEQAGDGKGGQAGGEQFELGTQHHGKNSLGKRKDVCGSDTRAESGGGRSEGRRGGVGGVLEKQCREGGGGNGGLGCAFAGDEGAQAVDGAGHALAGGLLADAQGVADVRERELQIETQKDGGTIGGGELIAGGLEQGRDVRPIGDILRGEEGRMHGGSLSFVILAAGGSAAGIGSDILKHAKKPGSQGCGGAEGGGLFGQHDEDRLGDVLGEGGVMDEAEGGGMEPIDMPAHELGEGIVGAVAGELEKEFMVGHSLSRWE